MQALAQACAAATASVPPTPCSVAQAKRSEEWLQREQAIDAELQSFLDHGVWEGGGCALPAGKSALPSRIMRDRECDGGTRQVSTRLHVVAERNQQQPGADVNEAFALVCSNRTLRMIAAAAARHGLRLRQFDIWTAFLNGVLEKEVYVRPPARLKYLPGGSGRVLRLQSATSMYGFRQAPRAWKKYREAEL